MSNWLLVIDDDQDGRELLGELLEMNGYPTVTCASAGEAETVLDQRGRPSLVLTDFIMPNMTGTDFVARMRARPGFADVPALFLTGMEASAIGPLSDPVLRKPFDLDQLLELVSGRCPRA